MKNKVKKPDHKYTAIIITLFTVLTPFVGGYLGVQMGYTKGSSIMTVAMVIISFPIGAVLGVITAFIVAENVGTEYFEQEEKNFSPKEQIAQKRSNLIIVSGMALGLAIIFIVIYSNNARQERLNNRYNFDPADKAANEMIEGLQEAVEQEERRKERLKQTYWRTSGDSMQMYFHFQDFTNLLVIVDDTIGEITTWQVYDESEMFHFKIVHKGNEVLCNLDAYDSSIHVGNSSIPIMRIDSIAFQEKSQKIENWNWVSTQDF